MWKCQESELFLLDFWAKFIGFFIRARARVNSHQFTRLHKLNLRGNPGFYPFLISNAPSSKDLTNKEEMSP